MTRRAKLAAVFNAAPDVETLRSDIAQFTASGKSGIETWLNEAYAKFVEGPQTTSDKSAEVADLLEQALNILNS